MLKLITKKINEQEKKQNVVLGDNKILPATFEHESKSLAQLKLNSVQKIPSINVRPKRNSSEHTAFNVNFPCQIFRQLCFQGKQLFVKSLNRIGIKLQSLHGSLLKDG